VRNPTSLPQMTPAEAKAAAIGLMRARKPYMFVGAPGTSKTAIILEAATELGLRKIVSHPVVNGEEDFKGIPWPNPEKTAADFLAIGELNQAMQATEPTLWLFDDLGSGVRESVQAALMQVLWARSINGKQIPDCVTMAAASNMRGQRAAVRGIIETVKARFTTIIEMVPDLDSWIDNFAFKSLPDTENTALLVSYLREYPDQLSDFQPSSDMTQSPSMRTWEHVSDIMDLAAEYGVGGPSNEAKMICGAVGPAAGLAFNGYRDMWNQGVPQAVDAILADPESFDIDTAKPGILYGVATALVHRAKAVDAPAVSRFAERCLAATRGEFTALIYRDVVKRRPAIVDTVAWTDLLAGPVGRLVDGSDLLTS
jgi:hypothetical protein